MRPVVGLIVLCLIVAGLAFVMRNQWPSKPASEGVSHISSSGRSYHSEEYGVAFEYPATYQLEERSGEGNAQRQQFTITLINEADLPIPQGGEGPPAITIELFQNNLDQLSTEEWIRNSSASNFKLSLDNVLTSTTVAGQPALSYTWDGLYRGDTIAIARLAYVYTFSVTYHDQTDSIRDDFQNLMRTVIFK